MKVFRLSLAFIEHEGSWEVCFVERSFRYVAEVLVWIDDDFIYLHGIIFVFRVGHGGAFELRERDEMRRDLVEQSTATCNASE